MSYFSHNGTFIKFHKTPEAAISRCKATIVGLKSNDGDGYCEEVAGVCWGVVVQRAETADPNADYRTHEYNLQDTGAILPETAEDREQEAREKRYQDRLVAIADSVWELAGAEDPHEILTAIERGVERLKANQAPPQEPYVKCKYGCNCGWIDCGYGERRRCSCNEPWF